MNDGSPALEVGFAIDTGGSFDGLTELSSMMDRVEAKIVAEAASIERATGGMVNLSASTASISAFASTTSAAFNKAEQAAERMTFRLNEQAATFGMTRAAAAAWRAEQARATDAAGALLAAEAALIAKQTDAAAAIKREADALRQAGAAYDAFEAAARRGTLAMQAQADADARATAQSRARADAEAATIAQLRERANVEAALARTMGTDRPSATSAGATYSALAARAAGDEARANDLAAASTKRAADEHARLAAMVQGSAAAQEADAVAAERIRIATDPLYATTKRYNDQLAESTRLYHAGATAPAEYARQQIALNGQLEAETAALGKATTAHGAHASATGVSRAGTMELTHVLKASIDQIAAGAPPTQILFQHVAQLGQVATMTEGGVWGLTKALGGMLAAVLPIAAPLAIVAGTAFVAFKQFQGQVKDSGELTKFRDSLGLTHKEMLELSDGTDKAGGKIKELTDVTVTAGDVMAGLWKTIADGADAGGRWDSFKSGAATAFGYVLEAWNVVSAGITAAGVGTFNAVKTTWSAFPAVFGDLFVQGVNAAIGALNKLVQAGVDGLNGLIAAADKVPGVNIGPLKPLQITPIDNPNAGAAAKAVMAYGDGYTKAYNDAKKADAAFWKQVGVNAIQHNKDQQLAQANALKANRTPKAPKVDHNALNAEAVEAQIKNLYALADAYKVSGAAALIAEAREKAESKAIKSRADVEAAVDRQVRLSIAQRVSDSEKTAASMRDQAAIQADVNGMVAAGNIPAAQADALVQQRIAELPILAAIEAAQQRGLATEADRATKALQDQRDAQVAAKAAAYGKTAVADDAAAARQLATLREEAELVGATDAERVHALATLKATQEAEDRYRGTTDAYAQTYIANQVRIADQQQANTRAQDDWNAQLSKSADLWDIIASNAQTAGQGMSDAFGSAGKALGDLASTYASYHATSARLDEQHTAQLKKDAGDQKALDLDNQKYALQTATLQVGAWGDAAAAAKGFFTEGSSGYKVLQDAEMAFRAIQFAMSIKAMVQDAAETGSSIANSVARTASKAVEAVVSAISSLPFPLNLAAGAATIAALAAIGVSVAGSFGGGGSKPVAANDGTGTVLGDTTAKSDSIKNAITDLKGVDTLMLASSRDMAASLKSIDSQIGSFAALVARTDNINASAGVDTGNKTDALGSILSGPASLLSHIPVIGGVFGAISNFIGSLFGSKSTITGTGLYGGPQTLGAIESGGYNAQNYSDVDTTHKFFGITTGHSYSTQYAAADPTLQNQFTLILKSFDTAIAAAAGPLGEATDAVQSRLSGFVVDLGKIDLSGLTGDQIQEKLSNVFGAAADSMAEAAFPGIEQFQKVGEGAYETLVRVSSTVESVTASLSELGQSTASLGIAAKLGLADQFDSVSDLTSAADTYFQDFYSKSEQAAAKTAQFADVFASLGLAMPTTLAGFRQLVEAQDLTSTSGQATYATLLKLAPAFSDLETSLNGAKSAADILSEQQDLQRQLLDAQGDTAAIRALDLQNVDASNRALQQQVWAAQDAKTLADAWTSVGDTIETEIARIRGLNTTAGDGSFASLLGQFNAATTAARGGDQTAANSLPGLSQSLLTAAESAATSRQELDRIQAQTAASLEATYSVVTSLARGGAPTTTATTDSLTSAAATAQAATAAPANDTVSSTLREVVADLKAEIEQMRQDNNAGHAATASNTGKAARILDGVSQPNGGTAITVAAAA